MNILKFKATYPNFFEIWWGQNIFGRDRHQHGRATGNFAFLVAGLTQIYILTPEYSPVKDIKVVQVNNVFLFLANTTNTLNQSSARATSSPNWPNKQEQMASN